MARLTDALVFADGQRGHELGYDAPHELLRRVEGLSGSMAIVMELVPRPEYGLVRPLFRGTEYGGRTFGGPNQIAVCTGVPAEIEDSAMRAAFEVSEGDGDGFAVRWVSPEGSSWYPRPLIRQGAGYRTPSRGGARGKLNTTSTTGSTGSTCGSVRGC